MLDARCFRLKGAKNYIIRNVNQKSFLRRFWISFRCKVLRWHDADLREFGPWMQIYCTDCLRVIHSYIPGT
jgi:hypothetical protein